MKERIRTLYSIITNRLPRYYKIELRIYNTPAEMIAAYAKDIDSDFNSTFEWYFNHLASKERIEDGELYTSPSSPDEIPCITTNEYIMIASKVLKSMGNKEIIYLFLRELGIAYYSRKKMIDQVIVEEKIKKFARKWYNILKKEDLLNANTEK